jgi:N-acetyl-D-muramate 6-phosphate phosphatase
MPQAGVNRTGFTLVLFDLDGTLADTAPDLAAAVNRMRLARGQLPMPYHELRPRASHGARGLLGAAFGVTPADPAYFALRDEFFEQYEAALCVESTLFPSMAETLDTLESQGVRWGIVTNKVARFTDPLVRALGLAQRAACVVSGDTTPHPKPHPAPLLHALAATGTPAETAIYIGDDLRDIEAGRAAGLRTVVATYGYLGEALPYVEWGADHAIDSPAQLLDLIDG